MTIVPDRPAQFYKQLLSGNAVDAQFLGKQRTLQWVPAAEVDVGLPGGLSADQFLEDAPAQAAASRSKRRRIISDDFIDSKGRWYKFQVKVKS